MPTIATQIPDTSSNSLMAASLNGPQLQMPPLHILFHAHARRGAADRGEYRQAAGAVRLAALYIDVACARTALRTGRPIEISALLSFHSQTLRLARLYPAFGVDTGAIFCNR